MPQTPLLTNNPSAPGPVNPATMYVAPEGVAGTNINQVSQAGAQQKYAPQPVAQTPKEMALQTTQQIVNQQKPTVDPAMLARQQAIQEQIRARSNKTPAQPTQVAGPVAPTAIQSLPSERWTPAEKLALERAKLQEAPPTVMTAADEANMAKQAIESQKATNSEIIRQHAQGNIMGETTSIDTGKDAYNGSNATQGKAKALTKAGVDSLPTVNGMTDAQVIDALHTEMFGKSTRNPPSIAKIQKGQERLRREFEPIKKLEEELQKLDPRTSKKINDELNAIDEQMTALREDALENRLKPDTPEGKAYSDQLNKLSKQATQLQKEFELAKKAEKKAGKQPTTLEEKVEVIKSQGENRRNQARGKPDVLEMKIGEESPAGGSALDQSIVAKRSFNEDMQKYRYGSSKDPLTLEEYNHLQNSDFIEKQNMFDILKEINPEYTEYSFWYKDKTGATTNVNQDGSNLLVTKIDKKNPQKETIYSKDNPDREDAWVFVKSQNENGVRKVIERFEVKDTLAPRHPKLKDWPAEFTNSKYDLE
jgi:hypothetical protein